jgi:hypothetical protein
MCSSLGHPIHFSFCSSWSLNPSFDLDIRTLHSKMTDLAYAEYVLTLVTLISMAILFLKLNVHLQLNENGDNLLA